MWVGVKNGHAAQDLKTNGAVVFRGFEISKDKATFGQAGSEESEGTSTVPLSSPVTRNGPVTRAGRAGP